jgi:predicted Zn-dependent protease
MQLTTLDDIALRFTSIAPPVDFWSLRVVDDRREGVSVRQGIVQPIDNSRSLGALVEIIDDEGLGYCATCDLTDTGLATAAHHAREWARCCAGRHLLGPSETPRIQTRGQYRTPVKRAWNNVQLKNKLDLLLDTSRTLKQDDAIVDWQASLDYQQTEVLLINSSGTRIAQRFEFLTPGLQAVANRDSDIQRRSFGYELATQGGLEILDSLNLSVEAQRVANEALQLLHAPDCPIGCMDVVLMPGQMLLQIHESIGHPLELDRILGDERNFAGTSFVTPDMFGNYQYGSRYLNVTFDPTISRELASYGFDDEGTKAEREHLIRDGILMRPLGGATSQARAGLPGVASARASHWNRPPVDRMANLNLEPGRYSEQELIGSVERGVLLDTNRSWSIDDSRNKFQFGCEYGRLIEDGELKGLVKNPNYRGISATFWRSLSHVGDKSTFRVMGVRTCGKGEPNQIIQTGHASPACVFRNVDVFSGV